MDDTMIHFIWAVVLVGIVGIIFATITSVSRMNVNRDNNLIQHCQGIASYQSLQGQDYVKLTCSKLSK